MRRGGGLATIFKENFSCRALKTDAYNSFELQLLTLGSVNLLVIALIYRPPKPHKDFLADFSAFLSGIIPNFDRFLILGDFNVHVCCPSNLLAKDFISLIDSFDLVQLVKSPTHSHGHTLDLVLSRGFSVLDIELGDYSFSDHKPILFTVPLSSPVVKSCKPACMTRIISSTISDTFSSMFKEFSQSLVSFPSDQSSEELILGLLDYDKNHNHDYFGQYCNHNYLTRLLAGCITKTFFLMQI